MLVTFLGIISVAFADRNHNTVLPYLLAKGGDEKVDTDLALILMMAQNVHHGENGKYMRNF